MFRNTSLIATPTFKLVLGFGLCTLGGAMLYAYFKSRDDDNDDVANELNGAQKPIANSGEAKKKEKQICIKMEVSNEHVPLIVGRGGANLDLVQETTGTKIRLRDKDNSNKFCDITGQPDAVKEARIMLLHEIERAPIVKEEIYVPQSVCGKIIGRCGETIQEICRISLAKVSVDTGGRNGSMDKRRIIITGNRQQVNIARKMIEDKIEEDEDIRRVVEEVEKHREPRRSPANSVNSSMYSSQTSLSSHLPPREKLLAARSDEKPMEVYVSAVASPSKFWVQLIGPQSKKLDDMVQVMTDYYNVEENRTMHQINEPYLGQIVAAIFKYDGKWYRAEIVGILPNEYNANKVVLDLYFVDYGDSEYVEPHEVYELRTDFLTLRFQAVECFLANVKSTLLHDPDTWDPQSIQKFEELTQVANWKKLISRVVTYKERPKAIYDIGQSSSSREGSPIPGIELFDIVEGTEVNIGHMLISHGDALPLEVHRSRSPYSLSSSEMSTSQNSLTSPPPSANRLVADAEDELMEQQLEHLLKNNNLYLNGDTTKTNKTASMINPAKLSGDFLNGNSYNTSTTATAMAANGKHLQTVNGNLSR